jgi:hypothetical protein
MVDVTLADPCHRNNAPEVIPRMKLHVNEMKFQTGVASWVQGKQGPWESRRMVEGRSRD